MSFRKARPLSLWSRCFDILDVFLESTTSGGSQPPPTFVFHARSGFKAVLSTELSFPSVDCLWHPSWQRGEISWGNVANHLGRQQVYHVSGAPLPPRRLTKEAKVLGRGWSQLEACTWGKALLASPFCIWTPLPFDILAALLLPSVSVEFFCR